jgi:hypothetical protein
MHVHLVCRKIEVVHRRHGHHGERLVDVEKVHVLQPLPGARG